MGRPLGNLGLRRGRVAWLLVLIAAGVVAAGREELVPRKLVVVEPGEVIRGAWQRAGSLKRIIERRGIRTVVTLTAINQADPKYVAQERVVREAGVRWVIVPMRGSTATLEQMAEAADLLADPGLRPVFFHCVGGHHRSSLVQAAFRIRHEGWSAERAWSEVAALSWARPDHARDVEDRRLIERFAASAYADASRERDGAHEARTVADVVDPGRPGGGDAVRLGRRVGPPDG